MGEAHCERVEKSPVNDDVVSVRKVGIGAVDVKTRLGFVFRFQRMAGGYSFDDGYLPSEDPDAASNSPHRSWVFKVDEVPDHIVDELESEGFEFTGESSHPRATLFGDGEDETWRDRAQSSGAIATDLWTFDTPDIGTEFEHRETGDRVTVVEHMFSDLSNSVMNNSPFVVERVSDGQRLGFEEPDQLYDEFQLVDGGD